MNEEIQLNYEMNLKKHLGSRVLITYYHNIVWPRHIHCFPEIVIVTEGVLQMTIGNRIYQIPAGSAVFVKPFIPHSFLPSPEHACYILEHSAEIVPFYAEYQKHNTAKNPQIQLNEHLLAYILDVISLGGAKKIINVMRTQAILPALYNEFIEKAEFTGGNKTSEDLFLHVLEYVSRNLTSELTLTTVSAQLQIRPETLCRKFKECSGMPLHEYISVMRINRACSLLKRGVSVTEASVAVGFNTIRNFNRLFKKHTQMTPTEFIANIRDDMYCDDLDIKTDVSEY